MNQPTNFTYQDPRLKKGVKELLGKYTFTHFVTLATNCDFDGRSIRNIQSNLNPTERKIEYARDRLKNWTMRVNRSMLGRNWMKKPDETLFGYGMIEHVDTNIHWHLLLVNSEKFKGDKFQHHADLHWRRLVPGGTALVQDPYDQENGIKYSNKELSGVLQYEAFEIIGKIIGVD